MPTTLDKKIKKSLQNQKFLEDLEHIPSSVGTYLKWAPFLSIYLIDILGVKTKNNWKKQILLMAGTQAVRTLVTKPLKKVTHEIRPESFKHNSFPSGHSATAFAGAEILRMELKDEFPALSYVGYTTAAATAFLRLYNNKHWFTDVVAGAAIGILSTRLMYSIFRKRNKTKTVEYSEKIEQPTFKKHPLR